MNSAFKHDREVIPDAEEPLAAIVLEKIAAMLRQCEVRRRHACPKGDLANFMSEGSVMVLS